MAAYRDLINADGVYLHYELNGNFTDSEGVGTTLVVGSGTPAVALNPSPVKGQPAGNSAYTFTDVRYNCTSGDAAFGANLNLNNALTIECWVKPSTVAATGVHNIIRHDTNRYWLRVSSKKLHLNLTTTGGTAYVDLTGSTDLVAGTLYHLVATWDGTFGRLYVNGVLDATSGNLASTMNVGSTGATFISYQGSEQLVGVLDELAIYRSALSLATIQSHYYLGSGNVSIAVPVANISVAGLAGTVSVSETETGVTPNISVAGLPGTVSADSNVDISVPVADVLVEGRNGSTAVGGDVSISGDVANISVQGLPGSAGVGKDVEVPTASTISVTGLNGDVSASSSATALPGAITVAGLSGEVTATQVQFLRPDATVFQTSTVEGFSSYVDEVVPNGTDFIRISRFTSGGVVGGVSGSIQLSLSDPVAIPTNRGEHYLRYRYMSSGGTATGRFILRSYNPAGGPDLRLTWDEPVAATWTTRERLIDPNFVKAIQQAGYSNLQVWAYGFLADPGAALLVDWIEFQLPDAGGNWTYIDPPTGTIMVAGLAGDLDDGQRDVAIEVPTGTITVAGNPISYSTGNDAFLNAARGAITMAGGNHSFSTGELLSLGVNLADITVAGLPVTLSADRFVVFEAEVVDILVAGGGESVVRTGPDAVSFRFIPDTYTGLTTADAGLLYELDFGALLHGQQKTLRFRLGNEATATTHFLLRAVSPNAGVAAMVKFSFDNVTFANELFVGSVPGNGVSDVVWVKMTVDANAFVSEGSFLIEVEQSVA